MLNIKYSQFFDRITVIKRIGEARRRVLSRAGAFVRTHAQRSIRKRKKSATPGNPPNSHVGLLRKLIFFGYDEATASVVIGPHKFGQSNGVTVPQLLEFGGDTRHWKTGEAATYRQFPFMAPAGKAAESKLGPMFANSVK